MAVWFLSNQGVFCSVGNLFGMQNKGTAHYCIMQVCTAITEKLQSMYFRWLQQLEYVAIASGFEEGYGFPNVIGCIYGTQIAVKAPKHDRDSYINKKGYPSINVMAVCDHHMRFIQVFADRVSSVHDACVL